MAGLSDKTAEMLVGISITGLVSSVVWLLKWCDRLDLECHDLRRDVAHLQRDRESLSVAIAEIDKENERCSAELTRYSIAIEKRFNRNESQINSLHSRRSSDIAPGNS